MCCRDRVTRKLTSVTLSSETVSGFGGQLFRKDFRPKAMDSEVVTLQARTRNTMANFDAMLIQLQCQLRE